MTRLLKRRARKRRFEAVKRIKRASIEDPNVPLEDYYDHFGGGMKSTAGTRVSETTALNFGVVKSCCSILAESVAVLPLKGYRRDANGDKESASNHPAHVALHDRPNPDMTPTVFKELLQMHLGLTGAAYARIVPTSQRDIYLYPLVPSLTEPKRVRGKLVYLTEWAGRKAILEAEEVLHIPYMTWDGIRSLSPVGMQREGIGLGLAAEVFAGATLDNGAWMSLVLEHPGIMKDEAYNRLKDDLDRRGGVANANHPTILEDDMKAHQLQMPTSDALFLALRKFQKREIAAWYRIPPHMIADMEGGASYSSIEVMSLEFVRYTLGIWLKKWEEEVTRKLCDGAFFVEFVRDAFLQGSTKERYEAYGKAGGGAAWLTVNEMRQRDNLPPIEGGDELRQPLNTAPSTDDNTPDPEKDKEEKGEDARTLAMRLVVRDVTQTRAHNAYSRLVRKECDRITRAASKSPEEFKAWASSFYAAHRGHVLEAVEQVSVDGARLEHEMLGGDEPVQRGRTLARELVDRDLRHHEQVAVGFHAEGDVALRDLLKRWESDRPARMGEALAKAVHPEGEPDE